MPADDKIDAACLRLQASRAEIFQLVRRVKGEPAPDEADDSHQPVYRSRIMRALTGTNARTIGRAALSIAISRPRAVWNLASVLPLLRPVLTHYLRSAARSRDTTR